MKKPSAKYFGRSFSLIWWVPLLLLVVALPRTAWSLEEIKILNSDDDAEELRDFADQAAKSSDDRFGAAVSAEAQKQRDRAKEDRKNFGAFVSAQRRSQNALNNRDLGERGKSASARASQAGAAKAHQKSGKGKP